MKVWVMIHKIKAMHDEGNGASIKEISRSLNMSRNTVRKYLRMDEQTIQESFELPERSKAVDRYRSFLLRLLENYPGCLAPITLSGSYRRPRLSKSGSGNYRQQCYFPAMVATRKNPDIQALYERLLAADKSKMCASGAAMRKLVHICYSVVKNQTPYQVQTIPS